MDRRTLLRGSRTHTIQYCTLKAIRGVDPSVRLICWTFTCSLKQYDKKLDKPQFRFPPHSANTTETRLTISCGFGWDYLIGGRTRFHSAFPLIFLCIGFLSSFTLGTLVLYHDLGVLSTPNFIFLAVITCVINDDRLLTQKTHIGRVQVINLTSVRPLLKGFHKPLAVDLNGSFKPQI